MGQLYTSRHVTFHEDKFYFAAHHISPIDTTEIAFITVGLSSALLPSLHLILAQTHALDPWPQLSTSSTP